jgi:Zn-dependent protease/CBS domain-containing protein
MKWSLRLGSVAGIGLYMHWTFLLLVGWVFFAHLGQGQGLAGALGGVLFILALFSCVVLHELGHALAARTYGVPTRDITLLPIGGVARLERIPEKPHQELWVAIAGPLVNVAIAAVLFGVLALLAGLEQFFDVTVASGSFLTRLLWVNLLLVGFNLLPAFPMDGGRVLRALLAMRMDRPRATHIAATVGQGMAIVFGILGVFFNPMLLFIALFVFFGAQGEAHFVEMSSALRDLRTADAMMTRFRTLRADDSLATAVEELLAGTQHDFPVLEGNRIVGLLRRNDLVRSLAASGPGTLVGAAMCRECPSVDAHASLDDALVSLRESKCNSVPVLAHERLVGMLSLENVSDLVMVRTAMRQQSASIS